MSKNFKNYYAQNKLQQATMAYINKNNLQKDEKLELEKVYIKYF